MMGTMFCQYETPCGWCARLNKECTEKGGCKPKKKMELAVTTEEIKAHAAAKAGRQRGFMNV